MFFEFNPDDISDSDIESSIPEQLRPIFKAARGAQQTAEMRQHDGAHASMRMLESLGAEDSFHLAKLFQVIAGASNPSVVAAFYAGAMRMQAHIDGAECFACGVNHDAELAGLTGTEKPEPER